MWAALPFSSRKLPATVDRPVSALFVVVSVASATRAVVPTSVSVTPLAIVAIDPLAYSSSASPLR